MWAIRSTTTSTALTRLHWRRVILNSEIRPDQNLNFVEAATCREIMTNRDDDWLEVAVTLIHTSKRSRSRFIDRVCEVYKVPISKKVHTDLV